MDFRTFSYELQIKEQHLDSFGHVNNATYLVLFEEARWDLVTRNGYGLEMVHRLKKGPVILDINMTFRRELVNRQRIRIETQITKYERKVGRILQRMIREDAELACEADFGFGLFDLDNRRLIEPTPEWLAAVGRI